MSELGNRIKDVIENEQVALFMKGTPQLVMCGNSDRALHALREAGAPVTAVWRGPSHLDLFMTGNDGTVWSTWWDIS